MAKKDDDKPYQGRGSKGYSRKIHLKLSKKIYAEFKKNKLPYSWNDAQKFTSFYLFEDYKDEYVSKIKLDEVAGTASRVKKDDFDNALKIKFRKTKPNQHPPSSEPEPEVIEIPEEDCYSVWKVPEADIIFIAWYDIANKLRGLPGNLNVRVNGGSQFGYTDIDHVNRIDYHNSGVSGIIDNIRAFVDNKSGPVWNGNRLVKPDAEDDGKNCSYFIDFVLEGDDVFIESEGLKGATEPLSEVEEAERAGRFEEAERIKKQKGLERDEARAKKEGLDAAKKRKRPTAEPVKLEPKQDIAKMLELLRKDYDDNIYTKEEYKAERAKLIAKLEKGGEL